MNSRKNQTEVFLDQEADAWFERNFSQQTKQHREQDLALNYLRKLDLNAKQVGEIGCADGWRLDELQQNFACECIGIEPSQTAIQTGLNRYENLTLLHGTAANTGLESDSLDILVLGFCLYLCDRRELFQIAFECDRILRDSGMLLIVDFMPPFPYKNPYHHLEGLQSYKLDYSKMFLWNPAYRLMHMETADLPKDPNTPVSPDSCVGLTVLLKDHRYAYPESPFG